MKTKTIKAVERLRNNPNRLLDGFDKMFFNELKLDYRKRHLIVIDETDQN
jgi:hypothetical protein